MINTAKTVNWALLRPIAPAIASRKSASPLNLMLPPAKLMPGYTRHPYYPLAVLICNGCNCKNWDFDYSGTGYIKDKAELDTAIAHIVFVGRAWEPKNSDKEAGIVYLLDLWFKNITRLDTDGKPQEFKRGY